LSTDAGRSTTSPAAIFSDTDDGRTAMRLSLEAVTKQILFFVFLLNECLKNTLNVAVHGLFGRRRLAMPE
jgi:hypothetical protein